MAKRTTKQTANKSKEKAALTNEQMTQMHAFISNETILTRSAIANLLNPTRNIDASCKYPITITAAEYKNMYSRNGLATRIVEIWPEECWQKEPEVFETEDAKDETEFEKGVNELSKKLPIYNFLFRADVMSGIAQYGALLLGLADGKDLKEPVEGISETGEKIGDVKNELLFLRPFDQTEMTIKETEQDKKNPRFGHPTMYTIKYVNEDDSLTASKESEVHWSRIIHLADNRASSDVFGTPRMKRVFNNILDVKKVSGGSAEMFWRGGFPGLSLELNPEAQKAGDNIAVDEESIKEQMLLYGEGMQRYLQLTGLTVKSLAPQVADPSGHLDWQVKLIALSYGVPYRVLLGTEEAKLASVQDIKTWHTRVARRQTNYLTPMVVRSFFDRLIALGVLIEPKEGYVVEWPDLDAPTETDVVDIAEKRTNALTKYVTAGVDALIPPREYLLHVHKWTDDQVDAIIEASQAFQKSVNEDIESENNDDE